MFGRALLARGVELICLGRQLKHKLDYHVNVQPEDYASVQFLSFGETRKARRQWAKTFKQTVKELKAANDMHVVANPLSTNFAPLPTCWNCKQQCPSARKCGGCNTAFYCSKECQRAHWEVHKPSCPRADKQ